MFRKNKNNKVKPDCVHSQDWLGPPPCWCPPCPPAWPPAPGPWPGSLVSWGHPQHGAPALGREPGLDAHLVCVKGKKFLRNSDGLFTYIPCLFASEKNEPQILEGGYWSWTWTHLWSYWRGPWVFVLLGLSVLTELIVEPGHGKQWQFPESEQKPWLDSPQVFLPIWMCSSAIYRQWWCPPQHCLHLVISLNCLQSLCSQMQGPIQPGLSIFNMFWIAPGIPCPIRTDKGHICSFLTCCPWPHVHRGQPGPVWCHHQGSSAKRQCGPPQVWAAGGWSHCLMSAAPGPRGLTSLPPVPPPQRFEIFSPWSNPQAPCWWAESALLSTENVGVSNVHVY